MHPPPSLQSEQERDRGCLSHWETLHSNLASVRIVTVLLIIVQLQNFFYYDNHNQDITDISGYNRNIRTTFQPAR